MNRRDRRLLAAVIVIAVAAVVALVVLVTRNPHPRTPSGVASDELTKIPVSGASLAAEVITPKGSGPAPLLVIPSSWGDATLNVIHPLGARFAGAGYQVVDYAQRGWGGSSGKADFAGTRTQQDASAVIDWALKHTRGDPKHVGMLGASYGAGISLLTAAHDKRVRAVAALSAWTDVAGAFDQNGTPNVNGLKWLVDRQGHFDSTVLDIQHTLAAAPRDLGALLNSISPSRSPDHYLAELNRNRPAIMIANEFEDSILNPMPIVGFFDRLTTPKRLEFAKGDHGAATRAAFYGGDSPTVDDAQAWLDHYLRGTANSIAQQQPILLRDISTSKLHAFARWPGPSDDTRIALGTPALTGRDTGSTWQGTLQAGQNSAADFTASEARLVAGIHQYQLPTVQVSELSRNALVWNAPVATRTTQINGTPSVHLQLGSASGTLSVFAYLYDVGSNGTGTLLDMAPYSATGLVPGTAKAVTFDMAPTSWTLPAGHHLMLVLDGADVRYQSLPADGTTMTVSSTAADPAALTVPVTS